MTLEFNPNSTSNYVCSYILYDFAEWICTITENLNYFKALNVTLEMVQFQYKIATKLIVLSLNLVFYSILHLEIRCKFDYCQNISFLKKCRKMVRLHSSNDQKLHKNRQNTWNSNFLTAMISNYLSKDKPLVYVVAFWKHYRKIFMP